MKLSIIIPAHNEEENIKDVISRIEEKVQISHEIIVVNDHSSDSTGLLVEGLSKKISNIKLVENRFKKGFANALKAGFYSAGTDVLVVVMADLCDDLSTIDKMYDKITEDYDLVCGGRYIKGGRRLGGPRLKGIFSCFVGRSLHYLIGIPVYDIANAFKMYKKKVIDNINIQSKSFEISMEIALKAYYFGFKLAEIPTIWRERIKGKSNFKIFKLSSNYLKLYFYAIFMKLRKSLLPKTAAMPRKYPQQIKNILLLRDDRFGEFLLNIPVFRAIKETFGNAKLIVAVNPYVKELALAIPFIDEVIEWERRSYSLQEKFNFINLLRSKHIDMSIMLNPSKEFNIYTFLAGIPVRIGYGRKWGFLLTHKIKDLKHLGLKHEIEYNLELAGLAGVKAHDLTRDLALTLKINNDIFNKFNIKAQEHLIVLHPSTSDQVKQWPKENFLKLAKRLIAELKICLVIIGTKEELSKEIESYNNLGPNCINLIGRTNLVELAGVLKKSKLLISGDSGPVHLAGAVNIPVLAIFKSSVSGKCSRRWGPVSKGSMVIENDGLLSITVGDVFVKVKDMLENSSTFRSKSGCHSRASGNPERV
ncbi:MAG: glycosyltransferase family 9 protein [Candidatus Omnitrophota bacterium]|nr:glycosyltransferase family 9 protein [Candidatus Omnitrophota bacterium]